MEGRGEINRPLADGIESSIETVREKSSSSMEKTCSVASRQLVRASSSPLRSANSPKFAQVPRAEPEGFPRAQRGLSNLQVPFRSRLPV